MKQRHIRKLIIASLCVIVAGFNQTAFAQAPMQSINGHPAAESFNLSSIDGKSVSLESFKGKFVLLNFWATWCAPCRKEMPSMNNLHRQLSSKGLEVVGIHVGPSLAGVKKFLTDIPVDFTILIDKDMGLSSYGVRGLPTTYLINPEGKLIYSATGEREWDSPEVIEFLIDVIDNYGRMTDSDAISPDSLGVEEEKKSLFAIFKESIGWTCDDNKDSKLLPN